MELFLPWQRASNCLFLVYPAQRVGVSRELASMAADV